MEKNLYLPNLETRKKEISRIKNNVNFGALRGHASRICTHAVDFLRHSRDNLKEAMNWKKLDIGGRMAHITKLVKHALAGYGKPYDVKITFDSAAPGVLGYTNGKAVNICPDAVASNDYKKVVKVCTHESEHVDQIQNPESNVLDADTIAKGLENYITPAEDNGSREFYDGNPVEVGPDVVCETAADGVEEFLNEQRALFRDMQKQKTTRIYTWGNQTREYDAAA